MSGAIIGFETLELGSKIAGVGGAIKGIAKAIPPKVWLVIAVIAALGVAYLWHQHVVARDNAALIKEAKQHQAAADQVVLDTTVANYREATALAQAQDAANVKRVQTQQSQINQESSNEYEDRLAGARAAASRLQRQLAASAANSGSSGASSVSALPNAASGPNDPASEDGFSIGDRLTATEQAIQLDELQKWVKKQGAVDVNGNPKK